MNVYGWRSVTGLFSSEPEHRDELNVTPVLEPVASTSSDRRTRQKRPYRRLPSNGMNQTDHHISLLNQHKKNVENSQGVSNGTNKPPPRQWTNVYASCTKQLVSLVLGIGVTDRAGAYAAADNKYVVLFSAVWACVRRWAVQSRWMINHWNGWLISTQVSGRVIMTVLIEIPFVSANSLHSWKYASEGIDTEANKHRVIGASIDDALWSAFASPHTDVMIHSRLSTQAFQHASRKNRIQSTPNTPNWNPSCSKGLS